MPRPIHKKVRYAVSLNDEQESALREVMAVYLQTNVSDFFGILLLEAYKASKLGKRKGTDKRDASDDNLSIYPHPRVAGQMLNRSELETYYELMGQPVPDGTFDD